MKLHKGQSVKVLFGGEWIESEMLSFENGQLVSQGLVKYDRRHVLLPGGLQYATSKRNIRAV